MTFFETLEAETRAERQQLMTVTLIQDALRGRISLPQYVAFLNQAYHHVRHTVPLLMACGSKLPRTLDWLRKAVAEYIDEEIGHDEWILSDIAACGADPEAARTSRPHFTTELMVAYAYHQIDRCDPVGFFGMVHVLEGTSTAIATNAAASIQNALALPPSAFTYLTSHGSLDIAHVETFKGLMNRVGREHEPAVVHCARAIYRLYADMFRALPAFATAITDQG
jgi:pyrroloquinoline quinone (PQQ) biosynthesis protein C